MVLVDSKKLAQQFLEFPLLIYKDMPQWIRPLDKDIEAVFDPRKNKFFKNGVCARWLLMKGSQVMGRVAAFVNPRYVSEIPTGGIGFFECVDDRQCADFMFDHCREWLSQHGMQAMDGPINFGDRDKWWGLLVQGFHSPLYGMNFHPPYYQKLFENYGFKVYFHQECFGMKVNTPLQKRFFESHEKLSSDKAYKAIHFSKSKLSKFAEDFAVIYNDAFATHKEGKKISKAQALKIFKAMKPALDERLIWFVYHHGQPIAFWINLPDLNQYFKHFKGRFGWIEKLRFLWMKKFMRIHRFVGIVFGVAKAFQGKGVDSFMIVEGAQLIQNKTDYIDYEMQWIGDFNPKMINIASNLGTERTRRLSTYRFIFDAQIPFQRHKILS